MIRPLLRILALTPALLLNLAHAGWEIDPSHTHVSFQVYPPLIPSNTFCRSSAAIGSAST